MAIFLYLLLKLKAVGAYCRVLMKWNLRNRMISLALGGAKEVQILV